MKQHTDEEIEGARHYFQSQGFAEENVDLAGLKFNYFVMPQSLNPELPYFVFQCSNLECGVFGIADSVPREFRQYAVAHEFIESKNSECENACIHALKRELSLVPVNIRQKYIEMRRDFFRELICYSEEKQYPRESIEQFRKNYETLEKLAGGQDGK